MYQKAPTYFDLVIAYEGWEGNYPHHIFLDRELLYID